MINVVCLNPCYDKTAYVESLVAGELNRLSEIRVDLSGKGINVALSVRRLGLPVTCFSIIPKDSKSEFEAMLNAEDIIAFNHVTNGATRTNLKVISKDTGVVTEFNEPGNKIQSKDMEIFSNLLWDNCQESQSIILTGSLPPGCDSDMYQKLLYQLPNLPCIIDSYHEPLLAALKAKPHLVKLNTFELQKTLSISVKSIHDVQKAAQKLIDKGAKNVVVTMGAYGAFITNGKQAYSAPALKVPVRSTVGAGDAMTAGLIYGMSKKCSIQNMMACGIAASAASVTTEGTQPICQEDFLRFLLMCEDIHEYK